MQPPTSVRTEQPIPKSPPSHGARVVRAIRKPLAAVLWLFIIAKLLIYDVDIWLIQQLCPRCTWVIQYKAFFILGMFALFWLIFRTKTLISLALFVLLSPALLIGRHFLKILFGGWERLLAFLFVMTENIRYVRWRFISAVAAMIAGLLILLNLNLVTNVLAILVLYAHLGFHFYRRIRSSVGSPTYFRKVAQFITKQWAGYRDRFLLAEPATQSEKEEEVDQEQKIITALFGLVIANRLFHRVSRHITNLKESPIIVGYFGILLILSFLVTVITSAFQFYALQHVAPGSFSAEPNTGLFSYIFFSTATVTGGMTAGFAAASSWAKAMVLVEVGFKAMIGFILVAAFFSIRTRQYSAAATELVQSLDDRGRELEDLIRTRFGLTLLQAAQKIIARNPENVTIISWLDPTLELQPPTPPEEPPVPQA